MYQGECKPHGRGLANSYQFWHNGSCMKPLFFVGSSQADLRAFPEEVKDAMGYALYLGHRTRLHRAEADYAERFGREGKGH